MPTDSLSVEQRDAIVALQRDVLEAVALRQPLAVVADMLCRGAETAAPELLCTVLLVDPDGRLHTLAAPTVPKDYSRQIEGEPIGPDAGSCGTAAYRGKRVEVSDIATDPLWVRYRELALSNGLRACWSSPIASDGRVVATFAIYYREPRFASDYHRALVDACVHICSIAIQSDAATAQIHRLAFYDQLTGLPNRVLLGDRADIAMAKDEPITTILIDVDHFRTINDSLGHGVGDRFLREIAMRLVAVVSNNDTVSRMGGDEFALLLPGVGAERAATAVERVREVLHLPIEIDGIPLSANASIGVSVFPDDAKDFDRLLKNSEVAMYQAKAAGRNCFRFFRSEMDEAAMRRLEMENAIRDAIAHKDFHLVYQPQINIATGALHGVEALIRWEHKEWGAVPPDRFIPLAEECGLIDEIDSWVLDEACRQLVEWESHGVKVPVVAVNASASDLRHDKVPRRVSEALNRYGLRGDRLVVEITEGVMLNSNRSTDLAFAALSSMGVRVSVDDFGTGYSGLGYLKRFPVSELKLDRSFVKDLETNREDQALSTAVIRIGQSLDLTVVAEGVESKAQMDFLAMMRCDIAQGYVISKPLKPDALMDWIVASPHTSPHLHS